MTVLLVSRSDPSHILSRAAELGCANRVIASGLTREVERAYAAADVFVLPTPYDAFGMVITEAMAERTVALYQQVLAEAVGGRVVAVAGPTSTAPAK